VVSSAVDLDDPPGETRPAPEPPRAGQDLVRTAARGIGQTLITIGLVALLFVVYELWVTDILASRQQDQLSEQIQDQWADDPTVAAPEAAPPAAPAPAPEHVPAPVEVSLGQPFALLHIPRLGEDWSRVVVEGAAETQLAQGPGHYLDTALPGQQGNFAVAGHRVGRGSPFLDLDRMQPGDPIVVETSDSWFVYRVLGDAATGDFYADPSGIPGQHIVRPTDVQVIAPTPGGGEADPATGAYLTLTTCHPKYSAQQRLIIHARLDGAPLSKAAAPDGPPALLG
jgi:sortase A